MGSYLYPPQVYRFLSYIQNYEQDCETPLPRQILDCGAGGPRPPLALFVEHAFEAVGVDIDPERVELARTAGRANDLSLDIRVGDMRSLAFESESFSYVYEFYSMCHLSRADMPAAIEEMMRVLRPGGLCFLGFMGRQSWPLFGQETGQGEVIFEEGGKEVLHSIYAEGEPDSYFQAWEILSKEVCVQRRLQSWRETSPEEWAEMYKPDRLAMSRGQWQDAYAERLSRINYTHEFYIVRK